jgi:hypothetical protein
VSDEPQAACTHSRVKRERRKCEDGSGAVYDIWKCEMCGMWFLPLQQIVHMGSMVMDLQAQNKRLQVALEGTGLHPNMVNHIAHGTTPPTKPKECDHCEGTGEWQNTYGTTDECPFCEGTGYEKEE